MISILKEWLIGIVSVAMIVALAESVSPEGAVKKIGRVTSGLLMVIAILLPFGQIDINEISKTLIDFQVDTGAAASDWDAINLDVMANIIEEKSAAYIQDKAMELGIQCIAEVQCRIDDNGLPCPASAVIYGDFGAEQAVILRRQIEADLAIPAEDQRYEGSIET